MKHQFQATLAQLEKKRLISLRNILLALVIGTSSIIAIIRNTDSYNNQIEDGELKILLLLAFATYVASYYFIYDFRITFKYKFVKKLIKSFGFGFVVSGQGFPLKDFNNFLPQYDKSVLEDHCYGSFRGINFSSCEAEIRRKKPPGDSETYIIFKGILASFDYEVKNLTTPVYIRSKKNKYTLPVPHDCISDSLVNLEDPRFKDKYEVFCRSQIESRYILTPTMMERLLKILTWYDGVEVYFQQGRVFFAMQASRNLFEPKLFRPITPDVANVMIRDLRMIMAIITTLQLNSKVHI